MDHTREQHQPGVSWAYLVLPVIVPWVPFLLCDLPIGVRVVNTSSSTTNPRICRRETPKKCNPIQDGAPPVISGFINTYNPY